MAKTVSASKRTQYRKLAAKVKKRELFRVARGKYLASEEIDGIEGDFRKATLIGGENSVVCLQSALFYYELTDEIPSQVWIYADQGFKTKSRFVRLLRARTPKLDIGIEMKNSGFNITNINRTIVDCFRYKSIVGAAGVLALKAAIQEKKTTPEKILGMAKELGYYNKILPYLEGYIHGRE